MFTPTGGSADTVTAVEVLNDSPSAVAVAVMVYAPAERYACVAVRTAATIPRSSDCPSPQLTITRAEVPAPGVTVSVTSELTCGAAGDVASVMLAGVATVTVISGESLPARLALTLASRRVVRVTRASPAPSDSAELADSVPAVVTNEIGTPTSRFPAASCATAVSTTVPPLGPSRDGLALIATVDAAAPPMLMRTTLPAGDAVSPSPVPPVAVAAPDTARTSAVPEDDPATNVVVATPPRVSTSAGSTRPRVAENLTNVPSWTAVPPDSSTIAVIVVLPPRGSVSACAVTLMVDSRGASSGTLSHAASIAAAMSTLPSATRLFMLRPATILSMVPLSAARSAPSRCARC